MSRILWKKYLAAGQVSGESIATTLQDNEYKSNVESTRAYEISTDKIAIPDAKALRSMSRASVFLSHLCDQARAELKNFTEESPYSVGIYCAVENGPIDAPSTNKILAQNDPVKFAEFYRKFRNPKMYLKQLPNLVPAQMGISLGLRGPMNVYTHSTMGSLQALEQAEWDLKNKFIKAALVCTAHAFDDFLVVKRERHFDSREIVEAAGVMLLVDDGNFIDWSKQIKKDPSCFYGISDQIINLIKGA